MLWSNDKREMLSRRQRRLIDVVVVVVVGRCSFAGWWILVDSVYVFLPMHILQAHKVLLACFVRSAY